MSVQEALKLLRYEAGFTQIDFANEIGRAFVTVNRWENGKGFPSRSNSKNILEFAKKQNVSSECISYLQAVLLPDSKRSYSAVCLGFPDIDKDFLFQLADGSTNALYVIEAGSYKLLYANREAEKLSMERLKKKGIDIEDRSLTTQTDKRCFHFFFNRNFPCEQCPLNQIHDKGFSDIIIDDHGSQKKFKIHAKLTETKGKKVYAMYLTDVTDVYTERKALYKLTNDIPDAVGIYNAYKDGRIELVFMNQKLYKMFDEERRSVLRRDGISDLCLVHPDDRKKLKDEIKRSAVDGRSIFLDMNMKLYDEQYHMVHLYARVIKKDNDKDVYYCMFRHE